MRESELQLVNQLSFQIKGICLDIKTISLAKVLNGVYQVLNQHKHLSGRVTDWLKKQFHLFLKLTNQWICKNYLKMYKLPKFTEENEKIRK